ncbi:MAG: alpha-galactosidase [Kiritimatiellaeota bacterium]|nr:alpha-galactosidase [Kiritimatiellota bacterium]
MAKKIVIIGAGSGFGGKLSIDLLAREVFQDAEIGLCDINPNSLAKVAGYIERTIAAHGLRARVLCSTDRRELLPGADFVVTAIAVGGPSYWGFPYKTEIELPRQYGIDQSVGDTIGPGGVFRFLRTAPEQLAICRDMEELCPDALLLNHTNPMAMLTWIHSAASDIANVGLCHSVQGTTRQLARILDVPYEEVSYTVAGINHQSWILDFRQNGKDLYPRLRDAMERPEVYRAESVRFEMMKHFGYFVTESTRHNSEYLPYFRQTPELMKHFGLDSRIVRDEPPAAREWLQDSGSGDDDNGPVGKLQASHEYTAGIIEAVTVGVPFELNGNVMNTGLITNLPEGCCVEVPCVADRQGVRPCYVGELPAQCAALNRSNIAVQELAVRAFLDRDRDAAFHAVALDPLTAAVLPLHAIREMFDRMWVAEKDLLTWFD